ncbi:MAG: hypothetical protein QNK92_05695 [Amylibacter sp.]
MKNLLCAFSIVGMVSSCGLGNSSVGSSAGSSTSASSAGTGSSASSFGRRNRANKKAVVSTAIEGRSLVSVIEGARFERTRDGGVIRARALMPRQGYYDAKLISLNKFEPDEKGVLTLEFRAKEPQFNTSVSTNRSREIDAGVFLSHQKLANIRTIRVLGSQNQVSLRK